MNLERVRLGLLGLVNRNRWRRLPMYAVVERFKTPRRINDYMQVCFEYVSDEELFGEEELWQPPRHTFERKRGDCEDFALFAWHVLRVHGFSAHLFSVFTEHAGHAVCAFEERGRYHTLCNEGLRRRGLRRRARYAPRDVALARALAESIYPRRWISCSFVHRLVPQAGAKGGIERFVPTYRWVYPE